MALSKSDVWNAVTEALNKAEVKPNDTLYHELAVLLQPKRGDGASLNPPILNEDGSIKEMYCRHHDRYEPVEHFTDQKRRLCKAAARVWHRLDREEKKQKEAIIQAIGKATHPELAAMQEELNEIHTRKTGQEGSGGDYDYDRDWADYNEANATTKEDEGDNDE